MKIKRVLAGAGVVLLAGLAGFSAYVASRQHLTFDHPVPSITASQDPAVIERGRYLVREVANCASCHGDPKQEQALLSGEESVPLSGGHTWDIPPGTFRSRNLTSDTETGIGAFSDAQLARALRFGIGADGRALLPFMEVQGLADDDLVAIISYLRTLPPVRKAVPMHDFTLLGKVVKATLLANPVGPSEPPPVNAPHGPSADNGRYLVEKVANCWACHTERSQKSGELVGPRFGGAHGMEDPLEPKKRAWNPPNITTGKGGRLAGVSEDQFVIRMRAGRVYPSSPMPWNSFAKMSEDDLRAMYRYLKNVPAVESELGQPVTEL